jgi:hypothetical protein
MKNTRRCKVCKTRFEPWGNGKVPVCKTASCVIEFNKQNQLKKHKEKVKAEIKVLKDKQKDAKWYRKELQKVINAIARHLDFGKACISCGKPPYGVVHGGHRFNTKDYSNIRFNLHNVNAQCYSCNMKKSGNVDGYVKGLHERYGEAYANYVNIELHSLYPTVKLGLIDLISAYEKARAIEARLKRDLKGRTPEEIIRMKDELNNEIGIYQFNFNNSTK